MSVRERQRLVILEVDTVLESNEREVNEGSSFSSTAPDFGEIPILHTMSHTQSDGKSNLILGFDTCLPMFPTGF